MREAVQQYVHAHSLSKYTTPQDMLSASFLQKKAWAMGLPQHVSARRFFQIMRSMLTCPGACAYSTPDDHRDKPTQKCEVKKRHCPSLASSKGWPMRRSSLLHSPVPRRAQRHPAR